jgi:hypothetical protein
MLTNSVSSLQSHREIISTIPGLSTRTKKSDNADGEASDLDEPDGEVFLLPDGTIFQRFQPGARYRDGTPGGVADLMTKHAARELEALRYAQDVCLFVCIIYTHIDTHTHTCVLYIHTLIHTLTHVSMFAARTSVNRSHPRWLECEAHSSCVCMYLCTCTHTHTHTHTFAQLWT